MPPAFRVCDPRFALEGCSQSPSAATLEFCGSIASEICLAGLSASPAQPYATGDVPECRELSTAQDQRGKTNFIPPLQESLRALSECHTPACLSLDSG
ncbi:hypothetical protein Y1Q_0007160 [Alligator mississippiensis]|uniref:Uncharacterized protein n=1 Tax=Alligator mississippiensis TaxID=8496 RepID=A0A151N5V5_ALLMI|nr:hypothetical protein Y1Q_0007160 [Alligator mississippiensis]